jgi:hypothetical protein
VTPPLPANVISAARVPPRTPFAWIRKRALTSCEGSASSGALRFYRLPSWCGNDSTDQLSHDLLGPLRNPRGVEYLDLDSRRAWCRRLVRGYWRKAID